MYIYIERERDRERDRERGGERQRERQTDQTELLENVSCLGGCLLLATAPEQELLPGIHTRVRQDLRRRIRLKPVEASTDSDQNVQDSDGIGNHRQMRQMVGVGFNLAYSKQKLLSIQSIALARAVTCASKRATKPPHKLDQSQFLAPFCQAPRYCPAEESLRK